MTQLQYTTYTFSFESHEEMCPQGLVVVLYLSLKRWLDRADFHSIPEADKIKKSLRRVRRLMDCG